MWINDILQAFRSDMASPSDFKGLKNSKLKDLAHKYGATKEEVDAALDADDTKTALVDLVLRKIPPRECSELCKGVREKWEKVKEAAEKLAAGFSNAKDSIRETVGSMARRIANTIVLPMSVKRPASIDLEL